VIAATAPNAPNAANVAKLDQERTINHGNKTIFPPSEV